MEPIYFIDRQTGKHTKEPVYGENFLDLLYGDGLLTQFLGTPLAYTLARSPVISSFYGWIQENKLSAKKIIPFIKKFNIDITEFADQPDSFKSFNDFFTRRLKPEARPIVTDPNTAIVPADGRYLFYQDIDQSSGYAVKGQKFDLATLLESETLAAEYALGSMVIARLCPTDYHRFHFPCDCTPGETRLINGWLYSVNPIAIKKNIEIFTQNKRTLCTLDTPTFGKVLFLEIGATFVGTIHETYTPNVLTQKGDEKGYFSFGGSSLILLFPPKTIQFDKELLEASANHIEIRCLMGQSMGQSIDINTSSK